MPYNRSRAGIFNRKLGVSNMLGAAVVASGTTTTTTTTLSTPQLNDLTISGASNPNIPFTSINEMVSFILYSNPTNTTLPSFFDNWETMIITIDTTTNGTFAMNTAFVDPTGLRQYIPFSQVKNLMKQFWETNQLYITNMEIKFRLPKNYIAGGSNSINQNSIDPTGAYSQFNVDFLYNGNTTPFAIPTAVEGSTNPPAQPVQVWYQTINNMILNWRLQNATNGSSSLNTNSSSNNTSNSQFASIKRKPTGR